MCLYACTNTLAGSSESQKHSSRHHDPLEMPEPHKAPVKQGVSTTRSCTDQASETPTLSSLLVPDIASSGKVETLAARSSSIGGLYVNLDDDDYVHYSLRDKVNPNVHFPECGDEEVEPRQRSRAKLMIKGEYKSPVSRQKQHSLMLMQDEEKSAGAQKAILSE